MQENDLISIIVPVYNVQNYLENCIKSIINQTYTNIELLLINDGSNDHSEQICLKWAKLDERIIYVYKKNETLGPTRNFGIQMARGKYVAFVDSDDWIDSTFIEKLYVQVIADDSDFARCDYYRVHNNDKVIFNNNEYYPFNRLNVHKMIGSTQAITIWTGLYKRELWIENNIKMPAGPHQDLAILGILFLCAKKISVCHEGLYFYRENREGNITQNVEGTDSVLNPLKHLICEYKNRKLFDEYRKELMQVCIGRLNTSVNRFKQGKEYTTKNVYVENIKKFFQKEFHITESFFTRKMFALGGYDLQRVLSRSYFNENIEDFKYQHSSIISVMADVGDFYMEKGKNYRDKMIEADCNKKFRIVLENCNIDYLLIDFMEERYDILDMGKQCYITYSDAFKETNFSIENIRLIKRDSEECQKIWKDSCIRFINFLQKRIKPYNVFLVKFFLAEGYGEYGREWDYENIEQIKRMNDILHHYYNFFEQNFCGINVIELEKKYCYTDKGLKYGCHPWHLNSNAQYDIQNKIVDFMKGGE